MTRGKLWLFLLLLLLVGGGFLSGGSASPACGDPRARAHRGRPRPARSRCSCARPRPPRVARGAGGAAGHGPPGADRGAPGASATRTPAGRSTLDAGALEAEGRARRAGDLGARHALAPAAPARPPPGPRLHRRSHPADDRARAATGYMKHAGAGIAIYRPEGAARSGVRIGNEFFPGVTGLAQDPAVQVALFVVPATTARPCTVRRGGRRGRQPARDRGLGDVPAHPLPQGHDQADRGVPPPKMPELAPQTPGKATSGRSSSRPS